VSNLEAVREYLWELRVPLVIGAILGALFSIVVAFADAESEQKLQQTAPPVRIMNQAELYRSRSCIVTRITILEPSPIRDAVTEFLVVEGGTEHGRLQHPKCVVKVLGE